MKIAMLSVLVILTGCTSGWEKQGATAADFARDKSQCNMEAAQSFPVVITTTSAGVGYQTPTRASCQANGSNTNCASTPGVYSPTAQQSNDVNLDKRLGASNSCLQARGYALGMK